jgi:hypothetical protein
VLGKGIRDPRCPDATGLDAEPLPTSPEEYAADIDQDKTSWSNVLKAGVKLAA